MIRECQLAALPGSHDCERLTVVLLQGEDGDSRVSLRQQTWAEGIGWYDQKRIDLDPEQLRQLRPVLGWSGLSSSGPRPHRARLEQMSEPAILAFSSGPQVESA